MTKLMAAVAIALTLSAGAEAQRRAPQTVRDYFMLLPARYFSLDCCTGKNAKSDYLKRYLKVEDSANGYLSGYGDAAQEGFAMALFKRPNGTHLIALYTYGEGGAEDTPWTVFLNYSRGKWTDVSRSVIKGHNKYKYIYELPRSGTTVQVFEKDENGEDWYKGKKLYDLVWKNGKFFKAA